ncbi:hypothetical protein EUGRSUZ_H03225 [Eucalyptus grandis]|uniref:ADP-ribosylation factor n=2 Tax=Eucalyptus grandis TaxID=71139 RepID=A0A059B3P6_EUCGR|nr:hypothetical protein EUGRSUZ_H03225 [Eucalyptus grandis]
MGVAIAKLAKRFMKKSALRIVMVGLDASGKTTILYKLKLGDVVATTPTIGTHTKELDKAAILVLANKQDLEGAMNASEVADKLGLHSLGQRHWYIQSTSAISGQGLYEGLVWLKNDVLGKAM